MNYLLIVFMIFCAGASQVMSQQFSEVKYDLGTSVEVQSEADLCADVITLNGSFSGGGTICRGPLPVTLSSFTASVNKNTVLLAWRTETELNNSGFSLERISITGGNTNEWKPVAFITGNGTTSEPQNYTYVDRYLSSGNYGYRLKQIDFNGNFEYFDLGSQVTISKPIDFALGQNYPNPSNPASNISFQIPADGIVTLKIYNSIGQEIQTLTDEFKVAGFYTVSFSGGNLASDVYYYKLTSGNFSGVKKMIVVK